MSDALARAMCAAVRDDLRRGVPARHDLPDGGRLFADHAAPLLAVHRCEAVADDDPARDARAACAEAHRLVTTAPAYVVATGGPPETLPPLAQGLADVLAAGAGATLVVEVWTPLDLDGPSDVDPFDRQPGFTVFAPSDAEGPVCDAADALRDALSGIEVAGQGADVSTIAVEAAAPPGLPPLLDGASDRTALLGLAVDAIFVNGREGEFYPGVLDTLREALAPALDAAAEAFVGARPVGAGPTDGARTDDTGTDDPGTDNAGTDAAVARIAVPATRPVGRRQLEPAADVVDRGLAACAEAFGFLLHVTPVNSEQAWEAFQASGGEQAPEFLYRPLTFDPDVVRRELFALRLDAVEDPVVARLLRERRDETAAKLGMLLDLETLQFLPSSLALYGAPDADLVALARAVLRALPEASPAGSEVVGPTAFAAAARAEIAHYHAQWDAVDATVEIRADLPGSLMVSHGQLKIGGRARVRAHRVGALLAHEVGTHVLTYYNGSAQPLRLLRDGLAGYEGLQEGLAVLSEWLVGGLTPGRFRVLAARVLGARALADGADFVETVRLLRADVGGATPGAGLSRRAAFKVALRLHRGGGLTKDLIYLRGLRDLLAYLGDGGAFWPLLAGKMALRHAAPLDALRRRGVLVPAPLRPRWATRPDALARLDRAAAGLSVLDLLRDDSSFA